MADVGEEAQTHLVDFPNAAIQFDQAVPLLTDLPVLDLELVLLLGYLGLTLGKDLIFCVQVFLLTLDLGGTGTDQSLQFFRLGAQEVETPAHIEAHAAYKQQAEQYPEPGCLVKGGQDHDPQPGGGALPLSVPVTGLYLEGVVAALQIGVTGKAAIRAYGHPVLIHPDHAVGKLGLLRQEVVQRRKIDRKDVVAVREGYALRATDTGP